jgi:esterase/lipase
MQKKKDKTPFILKVVRWGFPKLEKIAPALAHRYFIKIFFSPLQYPVPEKERRAESFAKKFTLQVAGKTVQCYEWGDKGPAVLLIHGWAGRATQFRRFIKPLLGAGYRVVGFDGPAHGNSSGKTTNVLEFDDVTRKLYDRYEPEAIIAHSFGGVTALYSIMNGLPIVKLINIASPSIGDEVIRTYLRAVNGSWPTGEFFKKYVVQNMGKTFDEFSGLYLVQHVPHNVHLLMIHDDTDKEVDIKHSEAILQVYSHANLIRTHKLGHTRILKDDEVIRRCVTFIRDQRQEW